MTRSIVSLLLLLSVLAATTGPSSARRTSEALNRYREFYLRCRTPTLSESTRPGLLVNWARRATTASGATFSFAAKETENAPPISPEFPTALIGEREATLHSCYTEERVNAGTLTGPDEPDVETQARKVMERLTDWKRAVGRQREMRSYYSLALWVATLTLIVNAAGLAVTLVFATDPQALECQTVNLLEEAEEHCRMPWDELEEEEEEKKENAAAQESSACESSDQSDSETEALLPSREERAVESYYESLV